MVGGGTVIDGMEILVGLFADKLMISMGFDGSGRGALAGSWRRLNWSRGMPNNNNLLATTTSKPLTSNMIRVITEYAQGSRGISANPTQRHAHQTGLTHTNDQRQLKV
jgi:hypothetical protein